MNENPDKKIIKFIIIFFIVMLTYISCTSVDDTSKNQIKCHTEHDGRTMQTICEN